MKKKKTIIIVTISVIILLLLVINLIRLNIKPKQINSVDDFKNVKEVVEYYNCTFISMNNSEEEEFEKDIRMIFAINPLSEENTSNKLRYDRIIGTIASKMNEKNFRIIDDTKDIIIRVSFSQDKEISYTINNDVNYFEHLLTKISIENKIEDNITEVQINSKVLYQLIKNNWSTRNIDLGTLDGNMDNYDLYFDEGYKIRKINGKVYNIVFTNKCGDTIVNNLKTNSSFEEIENTLGKSTYSGNEETNSEIEISLMGYRTDNFYIFFTEKEISIYPNQEIDNQEEFANLVTNFQKDKDIKTFLSKLTDIWPDYSYYDSYSSDGYSYVNIVYPLKGVTIQFQNNTNSIITLYSNFNGKVNNEYTMQDIKEKNILPNYVNVSLNDNLVNVAEQERLSGEIRAENPYNEEAEIKTDKYVVYLYETNNSCSFYSKNDENIDSTLTIEGLNNIYNLNDTVFVYGIKGQGMYLYDAPNKYIRELVVGNQDFYIKEVKDNIIYYDDTMISISM